LHWVAGGDVEEQEDDDQDASERRDREKQTAEEKGRQKLSAGSWWLVLVVGREYYGAADALEWYRSSPTPMVLFERINGPTPA
jgi:hypothetical protein